MSSDPSGAGEGAFQVRPRQSTQSSPGHPASGAGGLPVSGELIVVAVTAVAILIAAAIADNFTAPTAWTLVAILVVAYVIGRGLSKIQRGDGGQPF